MVSRQDVRTGAFAGATKQDLVEALHQFLLGLVAQKASAVLIVDEAQNLPLAALEQIRMLSNLETDKEKLLQIILVGQLNLQSILRSPQLRQLDQRISIRFELEPLDRESVAAYIAHRLSIAGGAGSVSFTPKALHAAHRLSEGVPRLVNLICDHAFVAAFSSGSRRVTHDMVEHAAEGLEVQPMARRGNLPGSPAAAAGVVALASLVAIGAVTVLYRRSAANELKARVAFAHARDAEPGGAMGRVLPRDTPLTIAVGSFPLSRATTAAEVHALTGSLESSGFRVYYSEVDNGPDGRWLRVLVGAYTSLEAARADADLLKRLAPANSFRVVSGAAAIGVAGTTGLRD